METRFQIVAALRKAGVSTRATGVLGADGEFYPGPRTAVLGLQEAGCSPRDGGGAYTPV